VEIVFLLAGLALISIGIAIIVVEVRARQGTTPILARVVGFSAGKGTNPNMSSFHPVAEYVGLNGHKYYVEGSVGSSSPLHAIGDTVTVLSDPHEPERTVLKSSLSFLLGAVLALMGLFCVAVFRATFQAGIYSVVMAAIVIGGLALKIRNAWRKPPLSWKDWQLYRKAMFSTRVFTDDSKDQIRWIDPLRAAAALETHRQANRFAVPVLFVLGIGLLLASYHFHEKTAAFLQISQSSPGLVVKLQEKDSSDGDTTYAAVVEYRDQRGENFDFVDSFSSKPPTYFAGQRVIVLYNPNDPDEAQIDRGLWNYWLTALLGIPGVSFVLCGLYSVRRRFRRLIPKT